MHELRELLEYHEWAWTRALGAASKATPDQWIKTIPSSYPSLRDTLVHGCSSDRYWLRQVTGAGGKPLNAVDFPFPETLIATYVETLAVWQARLGQETNPDRPIVASWPSKGFKTTLGQIVQHMVNHGSYHRGQVTTIMHHLGLTPASTDLMVYRDRG